MSTEKVSTKGAPVKRRRAAKKSLPDADTGMLESFIGYNLRRGYSLQMQRFKAVFGPQNIRPVQFSILALIHQNPALKQSTLGKALDIKRANVVTLLDELEDRGLVTREPADEDRRSHVLRLTAAGKKLTAKLLDLHARLEDDIAESLNAQERDRLLELLESFRKLDPAPKLDQ